MQIAVGLGGEAGVDSHALVLPALSDVLIDKVVDKVLAHGNVQLFCHACHSSVKLELGPGRRPGTQLLYTLARGKASYSSAAGGPACEPSRDWTAV